MTLDATNMFGALVEPPGSFILGSTADSPDSDGNFDLIWTSAAGANNYSIYRYSSYITEINGSLTLLGDEITDLSLALSGYTNGTYYFIVVAHNDYGDTLSNCIEVIVLIPPPIPPGTPPEIPGYAPLFIIGLTIVTSFILAKKVKKTH